MRCPHCQHENAAEARFCNACGARLEGVCPACSHANAPGSRFCNQCGQALAPAAPAAPPTSAAPRFASPQTYTPQHLAEKILSSKGALEGERKQVTVLFADLKGSLELLADRDPEDARALLDPVLKRMMEAVHRYEGTVNQIMGDGIMALFGAPVAHEDHAVRACYAALRMQESVSRYGDEVQRTYGVPIQIRVGLNSGEVVVRAIGSDLHMDYTAVGQTTHLAARMEQMAKPGSVLITADTQKLAEGYVQVRPLGPVPVKGLDAPIDVWELVGAQPVRSRLQAAAPRGLTPFVGREVEMAELRRGLARARTGHGQVVTLVGGPGVGKTRLFYEFTRQARADGCLILEGSAASYLAATPYQPLIDLLKAYFEIEEQDTPQTVLDRVTARVLALDERLRDAVAPILWLFDVLPESDPLRALEPPQRRARTLDALKHLLLRQSREQPLLLVLENLHWLDTETQALLDTLIESLPASRILLLVSYRPEYQHAWGSRSYYTQLPVEPLPPPSTAALLRALLGDDPGLEPLKRLLAERTEGHPFFLEESVRRLVETRALTGSPGAYRPAKPLGAVQVPATVQAVVAARIDRLPPDEKRLLQAASVIGKDVPFALLQAIGELPDDELRRSLGHLQAAEFLHETSLFPDLEYTFKHALTHDVAYGSLLHDRRRALHARIVAAMESLDGSRLGEQADRLAHHALQGELWEKAVAYFRQAGARAAERSASQEAVARYEQALAALGRLPETPARVALGIDLRFELRPLLVRLGRLQELLSLSHEAERMARQIGDEARLASGYTYLINYHYLKGEPDRALEYGERCLQIGEARNDLALQALARRYMGHSYHAQGRYRLAEDVLRQNIEALEVAGDGALASQDELSYVGSCAWLAFSLAERGEFNQAQGYLAKAQRAADQTHHAYSQAIAWTLAGIVWARRGHLEGAVPLLDRSLETCRDKHLPVWQPIPSACLGLTLAQLGRVAEGLPLLEEGVRQSEALGIRAYLALWTAQLGEGLLHARDVERARATAEQALALARAHGERGHEAWALRLLGDVLAQCDPPAITEAEGYYHQALELAEELGMRPLLARACLGLGRLHRRAGNSGAAQEPLTTAMTLLCEMDMRAWVEQAWPELKELGRLLIVAQDRRSLYDYLTQMFGGNGEVVVVLDRRHGERRQRAEPSAPDQRRSDRRAQPLPGDFPARGLVIIAKR